MNAARLFATVCFVTLICLAAWMGKAPEGASAGGFRFVESAQAMGVEFTHRAPELDPKLRHIDGQVASTGAAVSVFDCDGDGWDDIYVSQSRQGQPGRLFRNLGQGRFEDATERAGLLEVNAPGTGVSMGSIWADADGDGDVDGFIYKWGRSQLLENQGDGRFVEVTERSPALERWHNSHGACWVDYDRDGVLDLYVIGYFRDELDLWNLETTRVMHESSEFAENGGHNYLYRGLGGMRFEDVTEGMGVDSTRWSYAVAAADLDGDGWQDLYLANDYGAEQLFINKGGERFEALTGAGLESQSKSGMCVALGDYRNEGRLGVFVTNISEPRYTFQGNNLRVNRLAEGGQLFDEADRLVADCHWAWGAQFGDFDNDGGLDLFVVNGMYFADHDRSYWRDMGDIGAAFGSVIADAAHWPPFDGRSLSGQQQSRVLMKAGAGVSFVDVATDAGVTDLFDGRAVATADFERRGALDVLVANQRGPLLCYRSQPDPKNHWIQWELKGQAPNTSAIGASITLRAADGWVQTQTVTAGSGFCAQSSKRLHFGIGPRLSIEEVEVRWPDGSVQELGAWPADEIHTIRQGVPR